LRIRVVLLTAAAALAVLYLLRTMSGPGTAERGEAPDRTPRAVRGAADTAAAVPASLRNVFEYEDAAARPALAAPPRAATTAALPSLVPPAPSPSPLVRLVGLVRRGAQTKAALVVPGDTVVLGVGESAAGYTVVSIDEDEGVRVRTPDGGTIVIAAAGNPPPARDF
jgi:hypothetical protein